MGSIITTLASKDEIPGTTSMRDDLVDLRQDIRNAKNDLIRWMFIFWIGQVGATLAIVLLFLKK